MRMPRLSKRLSAGDARHFVGGDVFEAVARATCAADVGMPRKELYENWAMAQLVHDRAWGGPRPPPARVVDVASGHGLLGWFLLALCAARASPPATVFAVDRRMPESAAALRDSFGAAFPSLRARHRYLVADAAEVDASGRDTLVVALHACGGLSDVSVDAAVRGGASLCLVPCCHSLKNAALPADRLAAARRGVEAGAFLDDALDAERARWLRDAGMTVVHDRLPRDITPKNRVLFATPASDPASAPSPTPAVPLVGAAPRSLPRPPRCWTAA